MAIIGLDMLHVAKITEDEVTGEETYDAPQRLVDGIDMNITPSVNSQNLFADDKVAEIITQFGSVEVSFSIAELGTANYALLLGKEADSNGVIVDSADDEIPYFAMGFRSKKSNGEYRYVWMYKGRFNPPEETYNTQTDSPNPQTQSISGTFIKRDDGKWRARVDSDDSSLIDPTVVENWFTNVYETPTSP